MQLDARRLAALSGLAFAILFSAGNALWAFSGWPAAGAPPAEILAFYRDTADRIVVGASLSLLSVAAFVLFAAAIREVLAKAEQNDLLATTAWGGALVGLTAGVAAETINMVGALRARDGELTEGLAQALHEISQILGSSATGLGIGVFLIATSASAFRSGALPRWVVGLTALLGILLLTPAARVPQIPGGTMVLVSLVLAYSLRVAPGATTPDS